MFHTKGQNQNDTGVAQQQHQQPESNSTHLTFWGHIISKPESSNKSNHQSRLEREIKYFLSDTEVSMSFTLHTFFLSRTQKIVFY